ncbi:unnamed protein product [Arctia plantaginis]|uniref:Uncharacterized protein n=1 Tax=Arctia plantaginis TaxID=874455 RepID=A0A8S1A4W5_ARCPL|nr:unnamed protein product [Arctia plantaginis]
MNKIGRVFVFYILISTTTGAVEFISKFKTSTTTTKWKEPTTTPRWKELPTKYAFKTPSTIINKTEVISKNKLNTTTLNKESSTTSSYKEPSTTTKWKQPSTTTRLQQTTASKASPSSRSVSQAHTNNEMVAVASFSGIDSRNGRVSSMNGIKIFPSADSSMIKTDDRGNFIVQSINGKMPMPITITKQGDGVSGTIRILPGSVSVSSSASSPSKSGPVSAVASYNPWAAPIMKDFYFPPFPTFPTIPDQIFDARFPDTSFPTKMLDPFPFVRISEPTFETRIQDPWFDKNKYKHSQPKQNMFTSNWFYPSFNPFFNYW